MNYKKVIEDFSSGVLDREKVTLVMDNDDGYWSVNSDDDTEVELVTEHLNKIYGTPQGHKDIVDVLVAAGVPTEWC